MKIRSTSGAQTKKIAADLAKKILNSTRYALHATVVALSGDLGAGKTTFVQGFAKALEIKHRIVSPTFLIFRNYKLNVKSKKRHSFANFYHVDLYRIHDEKELDVLNFKSILHSPFNIAVIEWADKIKKLLPKNTIWVEFGHGQKENERNIQINPHTTTNIKATLHEKQYSFGVGVKKPER